MAGVIDIIPFTEAGRITGARLVNFRNDSDEPLASHKLWLNEFFLKAMAKSPGAQVRMIGLASRNGDASYNQALSLRRINKVAALIPGVKIVEKNPRGEIPAQEDGVADGDRSGFYRAVLLKWEGLVGPAPVPPNPQPGPTPPPRKRPKTDKGVWLIIGVDTFGIPIRAGVGAGKIAMTLLNDKGEQWVIKGYGAGVGLGVEFGVEKFGKILGKLAELGLKIGDLPNIHDKLKALQLPSATAGGVFKRSDIVSNYTIGEITAAKAMTVISGGAAAIGGAELGLVFFFNASMDPIGTGIALGRIAAGQPWGVYSSLGLGKLALEVGQMGYVITSVELSPPED